VKWAGPGKTRGSEDLEIYREGWAGGGRALRVFLGDPNDAQMAGKGGDTGEGLPRDADGKLGLEGTTDQTHRQPSWRIESDPKPGKEGTIASRAPNPLKGQAREEWLAIREKVAETMAPSLVEVRKIDPHAIVGARGSTVRGSKGEHKKYGSFNSSEFDVDAFIVSDELAGRAIFMREPHRWGRKISAVGRIQQSLDTKLRDIFPDYKKEPFGFRIFTTEEYNKIRKNDDIIVFK
jgi:hypothetical protein